MEAQRAHLSALRLYRERTSRRQRYQEAERLPGDQVINDVQGQHLLLGDPEEVDEPEEDNEMVQEVLEVNVDIIVEEEDNHVDEEDNRADIEQV